MLQFDRYQALTVQASCFFRNCFSDPLSVSLSACVVPLQRGLVVLLLLLISACSQEIPVLAGSTMGTTYSVVVPDLSADDQVVLQAQIDAELKSINKAMSTYQDDSSIVAFNNSDATDWINVPESFATVAATAINLSKLSGGAFDPTVGHLVRRWGFADEPSAELPTGHEIDQLLEQIGYQKLLVDTKRSRLKKTDVRLRIDLNAIAKGYAVDQLAELVERAGYNNYLVEIGGELRVSGENAKGEAWRIGIERPEPSGKERSTSFGLALRAGGVATSGDYRNAFEHNGKRYSHIIDARNGRPVDHALASVTVVADSALLADGWATALMVLGPDHGMQIAEESGLACLFILRRGVQEFSTRSSTAFDLLNPN